VPRAVGWPRDRSARANDARAPAGRAVAPDGDHALFTTAQAGGDDQYRQPEFFTWSAADGVVSLSAAVDYRPFFEIDELSDDVSAGIGAIGQDRIYWSWEGGIEPLPIQNPWLAGDGRLVAGQVGRRGARWTPDAGATVVHEFESDDFVPSQREALPCSVTIASSSTALPRESPSSFGRPLATGTLPLEHLRGRLPGDWLVPRIEHIATNARVLAGNARRQLGIEFIWLARLRDVCSEAR
jgi:hypothetical protein